MLLDSFTVAGEEGADQDEDGNAVPPAGTYKDTSTFSPVARVARSFSENGRLRASAEKRATERSLEREGIVSRLGGNLEKKFRRLVRGRRRHESGR